MTKDISMDFSALEETDFSLGQKTNSFEKMNYLGGSKQSWPIDIRILVNMVNPNEAKPFHDNHYHEYIDANNNYVRVPCAKSIGANCPICNAYFENRDKLEELESAGAKSEGHPKYVEWQKANTLTKLFKQKKAYSLLVALRGDNKVSILESKPMLTKAIFGDSYRNEPGAIAELKKFGASVYVPSEPTGWLTLSKTGEKLNTRYSAKPTTHTKVDGRKRSEELVEEELHPDVLSKFEDMEQLPKLHEMIKKKVWSEMEYENFVASNGTQLPSSEIEKLKKRKNYVPPEGEQEASSESAPFETSQDDFDPFSF